MPLHIIVTAKQVIDPESPASAYRVDREAKRVVPTAQIPPVINGFDENAVEAALRIGAPVVWMQLGIRDDAAAERLEAAGLTVVMNRCPKIEYGRLFGELGWSGVNTGIISSKRPKLTA